MCGSGDKVWGENRGEGRISPICKKTARFGSFMRLMMKRAAHGPH